MKTPLEWIKTTKEYNNYTDENGMFYTVSANKVADYMQRYLDEVENDMKNQLPDFQHTNPPPEKVKPENDFREAAKGDKVTWLRGAHGEIIDIDISGIHTTFEVLFSTGKRSMFCFEENPTLFKGHVDIKITTTPSRPDLKVDDKVVVWDDDCPALIRKRHFSSWSDNGKIITFSGGASAYTIDERNIQDEWDHYEIYDPKKHKDI